METMTMVQKLEIDLPPGWTFAEYSELNHHITLIDNLGNVLRLDAEHMVKYTCEKCSEEIFARSNHGRLRCPCGYDMSPHWGQAKLCFVPKSWPLADEDTDPQVKCGGH